MAATPGDGPTIDGADRVDYPGKRYSLGRVGDVYAVWDLLRGGGPVRTFPKTDTGWQQAWSAWLALEHAPPAPPSTWRRGSPIPLYPMRIGQLLDAAIRLYRLHWRTLIPVVAFVMVPITFLEYVVVEILGSGVALIRLDPVSRSPTLTPEGIGLLVVAVLFGLAVALFVIPFLTGAVVKTAADAYTGNETSVSASYRAAFSRLGSILLVIVLTMLLVLALILPFVLLVALLISTAREVAPGMAVLLGLVLVPLVLFVVIRLLFPVAIVVIEDVRGRAALRRSWSLARGLGWKIFGTYLVAAILAGIVTLVFTVPAEAIAHGMGGPGGGGGVVQAVGETLAAIVTTPFTTLIIVLLYFDARIRKEGLDLSLMARELGEPSSPGA